MAIAIRMCGAISIVILLAKVCAVLGFDPTYRPSTFHVLYSVVGVLVWLEAEWAWRTGRR